MSDGEIYSTFVMSVIDMFEEYVSKENPRFLIQYVDVVNAFKADTINSIETLIDLLFDENKANYE